MPHLPHDGDGLRGEEARVANIIIDNGVKDLLLVFTREGRLQRKERFENEAMIAVRKLQREMQLPLSSGH